MWRKKQTRLSAENFNVVEGVRTKWKFIRRELLEMSRIVEMVEGGDVRVVKRVGLYNS